MKPKNPNKLFPLLITQDLEPVRTFYRRIGATFSLDLPGYLQVRFGEAADAPELCFMTEEGLPEAIRQPAFAGSGVVVSVPVPDANEKAAALRAAGIELMTEPSDKPWGWRSFFVRDPIGVLVDFFHVERDMAMQEIPTAS